MYAIYGNIYRQYTVGGSHVHAKTKVACTRERLVGDGRMYTRASSQLHANRRRAFFACKIQWKSKLVVYVLFLSAAMRGSWFKQAICAAMVATTRE